MAFHQWRSRTKPRSESQVIDIEFADLQVAEVDSIEVLFNLFKSDVFATEDLADEDPTLVPAYVACIIDTSRLNPVSGLACKPCPRYLLIVPPYSGRRG